ncbi:MAG: glycoside hydrolase family 36 protein [Candidatus Hodarchaeales archaeon]
MSLDCNGDQKYVFTNGVIKISLLRKPLTLSINNLKLKMKIEGVSLTINLHSNEKIIILHPTMIDSNKVGENSISDEWGTGTQYEISCIFSNNLDTPDIRIKGVLIVRLYENEDFCTLQLILDSKDTKDLNYSLHSLSPFYISPGTMVFSGNAKTMPEDITFFEQGFQSWSYSKTRSYNENFEHIFVDVLARIHQNCDNIIMGDYASEMVTAISDKTTKSSIILGFCTLADCFNRIVMNRFIEPSTISFLSAYSQFDNIPLKTIQMNPIKSEEFFITFRTKGQGYLGLVKYAELTGKRMGVKTQRPKTGWCSWYYYYEDITNSELLKNVEFFEECQNIPVEMIQLDDGYFTKVGDFKSFNNKFPDGLSEFVKTVHAQGKDAGLWIAPFFATETSELYKQHQDWFINSIDEKPLPVCYNWNEIEYALDLTNPEVQNHVQDLIETIIKKWGFDFIKIDFVYAASVHQSLYSEQGLTRAQVYRKSLKLIRNSMGEENYLLGCGAPLGPSIGLVDAMRVSEDTKEIWVTDTEPVYGNPCLKYALLSSIYRSFMHNKLWINDPDCLIVRKHENQLTEDEIRLQVTIFGLSGGQLLISEDMPKLDEDRLKLALKTMPPYSETAIPIDALFESYPSLYALSANPRIGQRILVAVINWKDHTITKELSIINILNMTSTNFNEQEVFVFDWWNEELMGCYSINDNLILENISPHGCRYLSIVPFQRERTTILTSTVHISQGCLEIKDCLCGDSSIDIEYDLQGKHSGKLFFIIKEKEDIKFNLQNIHFKRTDWGILTEIPIDFTDSTKIHVEWF